MKKLITQNYINLMWNKLKQILIEKSEHIYIHIYT